MANYGIGWVPGARVRLGNLDFFVSAGTEPAPPTSTLHVHLAAVVPALGELYPHLPVEDCE